MSTRRRSRRSTRGRKPSKGSENRSSSQERGVRKPPARDERYNSPRPTQQHQHQPHHRQTNPSEDYAEQPSRYSHLHSHHHGSDEKGYDISRNTNGTSTNGNGSTHTSNGSSSNGHTNGNGTNGTSSFNGYGYGYGYGYGAGLEYPTSRRTDPSNTLSEEELLQLVRQGPQDQPGENIRSGSSTQPRRSRIMSKADIPSEITPSKKGSIARLDTRLPIEIEEDLKRRINGIGANWNSLSTNGAAFEAFKEISAWFGWPRDMDETKMVWKLRNLETTLEISPYSLLFKKDQNLLFADSGIEFIEFYPFETNEDQRVVLVIDFPPPNKHHHRTLNLIEGVQYQLPKNNLRVNASLFFETLIKATLCALVCSYKISRIEIQTGKTELTYLYAIGEPNLQKTILRECLGFIKNYQIIGSRNAESKSTTEKPNVVPGEVEKEKEAEGGAQPTEEQIPLPSPQAKEITDEEQQRMLEKQKNRELGRELLLSMV